ncbi:hypothetical protein ACSBR1_024397 [Camellia fascicularis]
MADSACVIFPLRVFRILEKPLHQFNGHDDDILDLSWSKTNAIFPNLADIKLNFNYFCSCCNAFSHHQLIKLFVYGKSDVSIALKFFYIVITVRLLLFVFFFLR